MFKLSVIVPVYKVEQYICQCIESIINQSYSNLEIILVDDGSPDNCGKICDQYAKMDNRIRVIHQSNMGLSAARNAGLDAATGYYIAFVDSDDFISVNMYENMISELEKNNIDIISCNSFRVKGDKIKGSYGYGKIKIFDKKTILVKVLQDYDNTIWNKVYKKTIVKNVRFPVGRKFEDTATVYLFFANTTKVGCLDKSYYYYRYNPNSITQTSFNAKARYDFVLGYIERLEYAQINKLSCIIECKSLLLKAALSCLTAVYIDEDSHENKVIYAKLKKIIIENRNSETYCLLNSKYKLFLWVFGRADFIHKFGSKLSYFYKMLKQKVVCCRK